MALEGNGQDQKLLASEGKTLAMEDLRFKRFGLRAAKGNVPRPGLQATAYDRDTISPSWILGNSATITATLHALAIASNVASPRGRVYPSDRDTIPALEMRPPRSDEVIRFVHIPDTRSSSDGRRSGR